MLPISPVFLVGFMATGKSTVGALVAAAHGARFVDLDDEIARLHGATPAAILSARGEPELRRIEAETLRALIAGGRSGDALVVATGGGAACHGDNLDAMRAAGFVVALTAPLDEVRRRAATQTGAAPRPLLERGDDEVAALYQRRTSHYRRGHARVATEGRSPDAVAAAVSAAVAAAGGLEAALRADASIVALGERSYPIVVADGALGQLGAVARATLPARCRRVALVVDGAIATSHGARAARSLAAAGFDHVAVAVPPGETSKSFERFHELCDQLVASGLDRNSAVIAVGGGVVGDLAGFAAASLYRGVACLHVPTTLLAMVDSAIGGKTGINLGAGKNLVGAFWQPRAVLADPSVLETLPARERRAAFGELIKYALLDGDELFAEIEALAPWAAAGDGAAAPVGLAGAIRRCAAIKSWVVAGDEREQLGERATLNLGHTVGHAIEAAAGYGTVLHGEAVALGLVAACRVSAAVGPCESGLADRVAAVIRRAGLPDALGPWLRDDVLDRIAVDKKRAGDRVDFIAVRAPGDVRVTPLRLGDLRSFLRP